MVSGLYHKDVFFPNTIKKKLPKGKINIRWTNHAIHARNDKYGEIPYISEFNCDNATPIECEIIRDELVKTVYRVQLNDKLDAVYVITNDNSVKTVWINKRKDKHKTLNRLMYIQRKR